MSRCRKSVSCWLIGVFAAWQIGALAHLALVPHALGADGHAVRAGGDSDGEHHDHDGEHGHSHDSCPVMTMLTHASSLAWDPPLPSFEAQQIDRVPPPAAKSHRCEARELYRLSPSNSPPATA